MSCHYSPDSFNGLAELDGIKLPYLFTLPASLQVKPVIQSYSWIETVFSALLQVKFDSLALFSMSISWLDESAVKIKLHHINWLEVMMWREPQQLQL